VFYLRELRRLRETVRYQEWNRRNGRTNLIPLVNPNRKIPGFYVRDKSDTSSSRWITYLNPWQGKKPSEKSWKKQQKRFVLVCVCEKTSRSSWKCQECQQWHLQKE